MPFSYSISRPANALADHFNVVVSEAYRPKYNAAPTHLLPVITSENPEGFSFFYWGASPSFANNKTVSQKLLIVPVAQLMVRTSFKKSIQNRRCIIPADGFYDWKTISKKEKVPYRFHLEDNLPFAMAGLWDEFENEEGEIVHTFMIITTKANENLDGTVERMPVILETKLAGKWLDESLSAEEAMSLIGIYHEHPIFKYSINPKVADTGYDHPDLLKPTPPANQLGNFTLFN